MSLGEASREFDIAEIQSHLASVETWLCLIEFERGFNRDVFLARLERAVEKRRRDAVERAQPELPTVVVIKLPQYGLTGLNSIVIPTAARRPVRKRDVNPDGSNATVCKRQRRERYEVGDDRRAQSGSDGSVDGHEAIRSAGGSDSVDAGAAIVERTAQQGAGGWHHRDHRP
jgi:hypothetical protein